jgi:phage-related protein
MDYSIHYFSEAVEEEILALPDTLAARYIVLTGRMIALGSNLGEPHTKALGAGLFELRLKGAEGIARVFYCTQVDRKIYMLHSFIKKTQKTPMAELETAQTRMKELKDGNTSRTGQKADEAPRSTGRGGANRARRRRAT